MHKKKSIDWTRNKSFNAYSESIDAFIKKPSLMIPFIISSLFPILIIAALISAIAGPDGFNYYYASTYVIISLDTQIRIFIALAIAGVFSAVICSYFDAAGIGMCLALSKGKNPTLSTAWAEGKKGWTNMIQTFLVLTLIALILTYPALIILSTNVNIGSYLWYAVPALIFYLTILVYPRVITVAEKKAGLSAIIEGIKTVYTHLGTNIINLLILLVIIASFSLIIVFSPSIYFVLNMLVVTPWINLFITYAYKKMK